MIARFVMLMLVVVLALPVAALSGSMETNPSQWTDFAVAAKEKKHKRSKKPNAKTDAPTVREMVTRTFTSAASIDISDGAANTDRGPANPYPSTIEVGGLANGVITDVNLVLNSYSHSAPADVDVLLSSSNGHQALVMSDAGSGLDGSAIDLTLDDEATASLPSPAVVDGLQSGTFRPTDHPYYIDTFAAPAPAPDGANALSAFDGADPNGTWRLWVMDNAGGDDGAIGSWSVQITAEVDMQGEAKKHKKHKKQANRRR